MSNRKLSRKAVALVLTCGLCITPALEAKGLLGRIGDWIMNHKAEISTVAGVVLTIVQPEAAAAGVALITLQGSMAKASAGIASDPNTAAMYAGTLKFCSDGSLSCSAARGLLEMEIKPLAIRDGESPEVVAFVHATNRVAEESNLFVRHCREGASLEAKKKDLQAMQSAVEAAADAYDRLGLSFSVTQSDIDDFQRQALTSGLPRAEEAFWQNAGMSSEEVEGITEWLGKSDLQMPESAVSVSDLLHTAAAAYMPVAK